MNGKWASIITMGTVLLASGCASMSGDECATSDWHAIGFEDGARGYTADRLGNHRKACAKHGVTPDFRAYQAGRDEGLNEFCQPSRGYNLGVNGGKYNGVCPSVSEPAFVDAYNTGYHLYNLRANVNTANHQINAKKREMERLEDEIRDAEAGLISLNASAEERIQLLAELKDLSERSGQLEAEIFELVEDRAHYEQQLSSYEAVLADSGY